MAKYRITGPDGATYDITAPDGATEADVMAYVQRNAGMVKPKGAASGYVAPADVAAGAKPTVQQSHGGISTEKTIGVEMDGKHYVIPTIVDGQSYTPEAAIAAFKARRIEPLGEFGSQDEATAFAEQRSRDLDSAFGGTGALHKGPSDPASGDIRTAFPGADAPPAVAPRMGREDMSAYEKYKGSPEEFYNKNPVLATLKDSVTGIGQGASFNLADEIQGVLATPIEAGIGAYTGEDSGKNILDRIRDSYERGLGKARASQKEAETRSPVANTVGQVGGGMAAAGTLGRGGVTLLNAAKPTVGSMALRGAGEGAAYGGAYGFGGGEGVEDRVTKGLTGGAVGAATGGGMGATGGGMGAISGKLAQNAANKTIPTSPQLKAAASAAYKEADQAGLVISPQSFKDVVDDIAIMAQKEGIDKTIHPKATAALVRLTEAQGGTPTLGEIDTLRRVVKSAGGSLDASERRMAGLMTEKLDDWVSNLKPTDVVSGDALKATSALNKGRELWSKTRKAEMIEEAVTKATHRAQSTGSGGNLDNAIRQNIRSILDNPKKARGFTKEERDMMEKVVKGGAMQNMARWVGKLSPEGNGLMMTLHAIGGYSSGGASLPLAAVGYGAKKAADAATPRNVEALSRVIRSGGNLPAPKQLTAAQRGLLQSMLVGTAQQGSGLLDTP